MTDHLLFEDRIQHTLHGSFHIFDSIINDTVQTKIYTFSRSAVAFAVASGRTLKPMMMALEAAARVTSDSLMAPTPPWMILTTTSSLESLRRLCFTASTEPCTSAFTMMFSSFQISCLDLAEQIIQRHLGTWSPPEVSLCSR